MSLTIDRAAATAAPVDTSGHDALVDHNARIAAEGERLNTLLRDLLPIEQSSRDAIRERITSCRKTIGDNERAIEVMQFADAHGYPRLSKEPFSWRGKDGMPVLVPFSMHDGRVVIGVDRNGCPFLQSNRVQALLWPGYEGALAGAWNDVHERVKREWSRNHDIRYSTTFSGVIPQATRERILGLKLAHGYSALNDVFIVAEVDRWERDVTVVPQVDPLVVYQAHGELWLIDQFDVTSLEAYVADEFTE